MLTREEERTYLGSIHGQVSVETLKNPNGGRVVANPGSKPRISKRNVENIRLNTLAEAYRDMFANDQFEGKSHGHR